MIREIKKQNLADVVYDRIRTDIISSLSEGDKIPSENQLSKSLKVSRVIVREALERLRSEHIIATYHGKGSFVANPSNFDKFDVSPVLDFSEFCEVMEFRACIEFGCIKRAVSVATDAELEAIRAIAREMEGCTEDRAAFSEADYLFHKEIAKASHNSRFMSAMETEKEAIYTCLDAMNMLNDSRKWGAALHRRIADKIVLRDAKGAIEILKLNGEYNVARMQQVYKNIENAAYKGEQK